MDQAKVKVAAVVVESDKHPLIADVTADFVYARLQRTSEKEKTGYPPRALERGLGRLDPLRGELGVERQRHGNDVDVHGVDHRAAAARVASSCSSPLLLSLSESVGLLAAAFSWLDLIQSRKRVRPVF